MIYKLTSAIRLLDVLCYVYKGIYNKPLVNQCLQGETTSTLVNSFYKAIHVKPLVKLLMDTFPRFVA